MVMGPGPWLVVVIACKTCYTLVNDPDNLIRIARVGYPVVLWSGSFMESVRMPVLCKRRLIFLDAVRIREAETPLVLP
uniref:Uncharacterized protein n=1 Tax=Vitis vinifera TaxID=29760 RepID=A5CAG0_VITVI|nr:hypothetical protein VITISV_017857 [Vitis vinifera]